MLRLGFFMFLFVFLIGTLSAKAQDMDYLKHRKAFDICSIKRDCSACFECRQERYLVKIQNKSDQQILGVYVKFYSPVFNKVIEKEARIEGGKIYGKQTGRLYVCVLDGRHWIFSKIEYADGTTQTFSFKDRLEDFQQEADECDCN